MDIYLIPNSMYGFYGQTDDMWQILIYVPSPYTVSSWILAEDWRLPVCNTLPFSAEMVLQRSPDKTRGSGTY